MARDKCWRERRLPRTPSRVQGDENLASRIRFRARIQARLVLDPCPCSTAALLDIVRYVYVDLECTRIRIAAVVSSSSGRCRHPDRSPRTSKRSEHQKYPPTAPSAFRWRPIPKTRFRPSQFRPIGRRARISGK